MTLEYKYVPLAEFKMSDEGPGTLEGYANVSGVLDDGADIVTGYDDIEDTIASGFTAESHDWVFSKATGYFLDAKDDGKGLYSSMQFHTTDHAQDVRTIAKERKEAGKSVGLSIGYAPSGPPVYVYPKDYAKELPKYVKPDSVQATLTKAASFNRVRVLRVAVKEFSIVTSPMNKLSEAAAVKSMRNGKKDFLTISDLQVYISEPKTLGEYLVVKLATAEKAGKGKFTDLMYAVAEKAGVNVVIVNDLLNNIKGDSTPIIIKSFIDVLGLTAAELDAFNLKSTSVLNIKGIFEDELAERNNNPWSYWDVMCCLIYRLVYAIELTEDIVTPDALLSAFDEAGAEFVARLRAWFMAEIVDEAAEETAETLTMAGLLAPLDAKQTLASQSDRLSSALDVYLDRVKALNKRRLEDGRKEGRTFGAASRERMAANLEKMDAAVEHLTTARNDLKDMLDGADMPPAVLDPLPEKTTLPDFNSLLAGILKAEMEASQVLHGELVS